MSSDGGLPDASGLHGPLLPEPNPSMCCLVLRFTDPSAAPVCIAPFVDERQIVIEVQRPDLTVESTGLSVSELFPVESVDHPFQHADGCGRVLRVFAAAIAGNIRSQQIFDDIDAAFDESRKQALERCNDVLIDVAAIVDDD